MSENIDHIKAFEARLASIDKEISLIAKSEVETEEAQSRLLALLGSTVPYFVPGKVAIDTDPKSADLMGIVMNLAMQNARLTSRMSAQRKEITHLSQSYITRIEQAAIKRAAQTPAKAPDWAKRGLVVQNQYGELATIKNFGALGFVSEDSEVNKHWFSWRPAETT